MKIKQILVLLVVLTTVIPKTFSQQNIHAYEAIQAALNIVSALHNDSVFQLESINVCTNSKSDTIMYEVFVKEGETVLLSGSRACVPILGIYPSGIGSLIINQHDIPKALCIFINDYIEQIEESFSISSNVLYYSDEWDKLIVNKDVVIGPTVGPLITSLWGQDASNDGLDPYAYNNAIQESCDNCPRCKAGCTAVAMAQVMNYWKYPVLRSDSVQIDWCNMADSLVKNDENYERSKKAVSELIALCATQVTATYGCDASGSYMGFDRKALIKTFNYSDNAKRENRGILHIGWTDSLKRDLMQFRPILYSSKEHLLSGVAHAFVCDGFRGNLFHFNFGWLKDFGWYTLSDIHPGTHNFQYRHSATYHIYPRENQDFCNMELVLSEFYDSIYNDPDCNYIPSRIVPQTMSTLISAVASSPESWRVIWNGDTAIYKAHETIILNDGFRAEPGAVFRAEIEPCSACEETIRNVIEYIDNKQPITDKDTCSPAIWGPYDTIFENNLYMDIYPNPTGNIVTITFSDNVECNLYLFDSFGNIMYTASDSSNTINMSNFPSGRYILVAVSSDRRTAYSIIMKL